MLLQQIDRSICSKDLSTDTGLRYCCERSETNVAEVLSKEWSTPQGAWKEWNGGRRTVIAAAEGVLKILP